jgi:6-pyruvoyltetrahydropterin/6-carboxytetrahydropterin synthase
MTTTIGNRYELIAGHWLPNVADNHKCKRPHGHNYEIEVVLSGPIQETGFILDFFDLDRIVLPLIDYCDHRMLNDIEGLENPTAEFIAYWFRERIASALSQNVICESVQVWETKNCWAISKRNPEF